MESDSAEMAGTGAAHAQSLAFESDGVAGHQLLRNRAEQLDIDLKCFIRRRLGAGKPLFFLP